VSVTVSASVKQSRRKATRNTLLVQNSSVRNHGIVSSFRSRGGFDAVFGAIAFCNCTLLENRRAIYLSSRKHAFLQIMQAMRGRIALQKHSVRNFTGRLVRLRESSPRDESVRWRTLGVRTRLRVAFGYSKQPLFPSGASLQSSHDKSVERHPCRFLTSARCSDDWDLWNAASAVSQSSAIAIE